MSDLAVSTTPTTPAPSALSRAARELSDVDPLAAKLAHWLDSAFRVPGTQMRFGLDAILGLVAPGLGDVATGGLSTYLFLVALRRRVPLIVIAKMGVNVLLDVAIGAVPVLGDLFDFAWKSNERNLELIRRHADLASPPGAVETLIVLGLVAIVLASALAPFVLAILLGWGLFGALLGR